MIPITHLAFAVSTVTAVFGLFVAYQAYRGYRRNDSHPMGALALGIVFIAVLPFVVIRPVNALVGFTDAQALVLALLAHTIGLLVIYWSFE